MFSFFLGEANTNIFPVFFPISGRRPENPVLEEVRPFFLRDNSIWSFPSVSSLSDYSIWRS